MALALAAVLPMAANANDLVQGSGRVHGAWCAKALKLVLDDRRVFEIEPQFAKLIDKTVDVRNGTVRRSVCSMAPLLAADIVAAAPRPTAELTLPSGQWSARAREIDALARRHPYARFHFRLTGPAAATDAARVGLQLARTNPSLLARSAIEPDAGNAPPAGWRVRHANNDDHAATADDVDRLLAGRR